MDDDGVCVPAHQVRGGFNARRVIQRYPIAEGLLEPYIDQVEILDIILNNKCFQRHAGVLPTRLSRRLPTGMSVRSCSVNSAALL